MPVAATQSATIMMSRRSHRSASAPAMGDSTTAGSSARTVAVANNETDRVCWYTHRPMPKPVSPLPISETS